MEAKTIKANELYDQARRYLSENKTKDAVLTFREAMVRAEEIGEYWLYARALNGLGVTYADMGNDTMAMDCYLDGLRYIKKHDVTGMAHLYYNNVGMRYYDLGAYREALEYFQLAEEAMSKAAEGLEDRVLFAIIVYINLADCFRYSKEYDKVEDCLSKAKEYARKYRQPMYDFSIQIINAWMELNKGNAEYVLEHADELMNAMDYDQECMGDYSGTVRSFIGLLAQAGAFDTMKMVIEKYEKLVEQSGDNRKYRLQVIEHYIRYYECIQDEENYKNACVKYTHCMEECEEELRQEKLMTLNMKVALKKIEDDLKQAQTRSEIDSLTGLKNRYAMDQELAEAVQQCLKEKQNLIVGVLDIDCFKQYNDTYGHVKGDVVLQRVGKVLLDSLGDAGEVYRLGGDEFLVTLRQCSREKAELVAAEIDQRIRKEKVENRNSFVSDFLTVSQGYYIAVPEEGQSFTDYIDRADKALYRVKRNGRNSFLFSKE